MLFTYVQLLVAAANGVVIATEKKLPSILVDETSVSDFFFSHMSIDACCRWRKNYVMNKPFFTRRDSLRSYIHVFIATSLKGIVY